MLSQNISLEPKTKHNLDLLKNFQFNPNNCFFNFLELPANREIHYSHSSSCSYSLGGNGEKERHVTLFCSPAYFPSPSLRSNGFSERDTYVLHTINGGEGEMKPPPFPPPTFFSSFCVKLIL